MSTAELLASIKAIEDNPKNRMPPGGLWIYTKSARTKLDRLRQEITHNMRQERIARGDTVNDAGYSGRQTNR